MKTAESLKEALAKYKDELANIRQKIKEVDDVWFQSGCDMKNKDFIVACSNEVEELRRLESEADFRVRFTEWVLA